MKSLAILLALCLSAMSVHAQTTTNTQPKSVLVVAVCTFCVIAGGAYVIYVYSCTPGPDTPVPVVLYQSEIGLNQWTPILTNTVVLGGLKPIEFFRKQHYLTNEWACYKAEPLR